MDTINPKYRPNSNKLDINNLAEKIFSGDKLALARGITYLENDQNKDVSWVKELLTKGGERIKQSIRIGVTGPPGVGKSSFINRYGSYLLSKGHSIAVLAVDPSSSITKGSILGDKTRMEQLGHHEKVFIRPSPSSLHLGGIRPSTLASIQLCEAAGYEYIFVESVGVGQSETGISDVVDILCLLFLPGSGDDIQTIKKGINELGDICIIHKADGPQKDLAKERFHILRKAMQDGGMGKRSLIQFSSLHPENIAQLDTLIEEEIATRKSDGTWMTKRTNQKNTWLQTEMMLILKNFIEQHPIFAEKLQQLYSDNEASETIPIEMRSAIFTFLTESFPTDSGSSS